MKKAFSLLLSAALILSLAACSSTGGTSSSPSVPSSSSEVQGSGDVFPFTLTTYNDMEVTFTKVPERVISTNVNTGEQLMALGLGDKIIGTYNNNAVVAPQYQEEYESKPVLAEKAPSLEVILELQPDFLYGRSSAFSEKAIGTHDTLTSYGIPTLSSYESYKLGADVEDVYQDFYNLGKIFQVEDRAEAIVSEMKARIAVVDETVKDVTPVRVFVYDTGKDGGAYTPGNNFTSKLIRHAGGVNIFEELEKTWNTVSWEAVVEGDPEVIVINDYGATSLEEKIQELKTNPALADVSAIKNDRIISVTLPEVFASSRTHETIEIFAKAFHPDLF